MSIFQRILQFLGLLQKQPVVQAAESTVIKAVEPAAVNAVGNALKNVPTPVQAVAEGAAASALENLNKNLPGA